MQEKKRPQRMCAGCGQSRDKSELIRVVAKPDGELTIDRKGKISGRGAYICPSEECLKKAIKTRRLERGLKVAVPEEIYGQLAKEINGEQQ